MHLRPLAKAGLLTVVGGGGLAERTSVYRASSRSQGDCPLRMQRRKLRRRPVNGYPRQGGS